MAPTKRAFGTVSNVNNTNNLSRQPSNLKSKPLQERPASQLINAAGPPLKRSVHDVSPSKASSQLGNINKKLKHVQSSQDVDIENLLPPRSTVQSIISKHEELAKPIKEKGLSSALKVKPELTNTIETKIKAIHFTEDGTTDKRKLFGDSDLNLFSKSSLSGSKSVGKSSIKEEDEDEGREGTSDEVKTGLAARLQARDGVDFSDPYSYYGATSRLPDMPEDLSDFDESQLCDLYAEPHYAGDIFTYYRNKEELLRIKKYMDFQTEISKSMRAVLVDWMVEVQESFELNHETLYLAVKMVDFYAMRERISKRDFQLIGATCLLIASKFDERIPPAIEDFQYICDDAYDRHQIIHMEIQVLKIIDFELSFPLSYRFLRRYARVAKLPMDVLTLARYILEASLMDYDLIDEKDSKLSAAALLLALKMKKASTWNASLEYYSGYAEHELTQLMKKLNIMIAELPTSDNLKTIHTKYSHKVFWEVAKIAPLPIH